MVIEDLTEFDKMTSGADPIKYFSEKFDSTLEFGQSNQSCEQF